MLWTLGLSLYFVAAALLFVGGQRLGRVAGLVGASPFIVHLLLIGAWAAPATAEPATTPVAERIDWIPGLGVAIGFRVGTLAVVLSTLVAAIGLVIVVYARRYFGPGPDSIRFLAMLALFSGGMAGLVSSDQLFGLFLFWEITTVASYLLIGFDDKSASARSAALQAMLVTTAGGLAMLAGFVLLAREAGTTSLSEMVTAAPTGTTVTVALALVFLGAFTKSAQAPFHFWLPEAMAAPTPASAYLHSATMVKAGVVLLVVLAPGFADQPLWLPVLSTIGLLTMVWGASLAIRQTDLKLLLAYGTISQLGFMTALVGMNLIGAAVAVLVGHALFKAGLFLVVGAIDKATGTRDVAHLRGLVRSAPALAATAALLTLSMAGLPPLVGFVTKEAAFAALIAAGEWVGLGAIASASVVTVAYSFRFWFGAFGGSREAPTPLTKPAEVGPLNGPVLVFAALSLGFGLVPGRLDEVVRAAADQEVKLLLWPGFTAPLMVSALVGAFGLLLGWWNIRLDAGPGRRIGLTAAGTYRTALAALNRVAHAVTSLVQNGSLPTYLAIILSTVVTVPVVVWATRWDGRVELGLSGGVAEVALGLAAMIGALAAARAERRLAAVLSLGLVGYSVAGIYVMFGAPDLALTQVLIETLTVALFALVLVKLPRRFDDGPRSLSRRVRLVVAGAVGTFAATAAVVITSVTPDRSVADAYVANAEGAGGTNVVNVILTNFRALDTLGEITVLAAAAIGITGLVSTRRRQVDLTPATADEPKGLVRT